MYENTSVSVNCICVICARVSMYSSKLIIPVFSEEPSLANWHAVFFTNDGISSFILLISI